MSEGYDVYALQARVAELERKVEYLMQHAGQPSEPPVSALDGGVSPAVLDLLRKGNKIAAIKRFREETGSSLADAKHAVDAEG